MPLSRDYILVAEPHAPTSRALTAALTSSTGLPCEVVTDGMAAHDVLLHRGVPHALVTNLTLTRRDGFALIRSLRKLDRQREVPVVAYAAQPQIRRTAESYRVELGPLQVLDSASPAGAVVQALNVKAPSTPPPRAGAATAAGAATVVPPPTPITMPVPAQADRPVVRSPAAPPPVRTISSPPPPADARPPSPSHSEVFLPPPPRQPSSPGLRGSSPPRPATGPRDADATREAARLARIDALRVVDESPDARLQQMVADAAHSFGTPTAIVTVLLGDRTWFKAYHGITPQQERERTNDRQTSFCQHVVEGREAMVIPDAREHPHFASYPSVAGGLVGYAGVPLVASDGEVLGAFCIVDTKPLDIGPAEVHRLQGVARNLMGEIELQATQHRIEAIASSPPTPPIIDALPAGTRQAVEPWRAAETARPARPPSFRSATPPTPGDPAPPRPPPPAPGATARAASPLVPPPTPREPLDDTTRQAVTRLEGLRRQTAPAARPAPLARPPAPTEEESAERMVALTALTGALAPLPCAVIVFDQQRRTLFANESFHRLFEVPSGSLVGVARSVVLARLSDRLLDPDDAMDRLSVPAAGPFVLRERLLLRDPPGQVIWWSSSPLPLAGGEVQITTISVGGFAG